MTLYIWDVVHTFMNRSIKAMPTYASLGRTTSTPYNNFCLVTFVGRWTHIAMVLKAEIWRFGYSLFDVLLNVPINSYGHGRTVSSPNHTFSWASLNKQLTSNTFACNWQQPFLNASAEGRRMTVEIISWSISTRVWDRARIELATPGSAVRNASVARHVTDCPMQPVFGYSETSVMSDLIKNIWKS